MKRSLYIAKIFAVICVLAMAVSLVGPITMANADEETVLDYDKLLFDTSYVHEINIDIAEEDWEDLKKNPTKETKYSTTVTVDGEVYEKVQFKTKGNTSLSSVAMMDSDRYSFKLNFGVLNDGQTYHGLKKLHLGNIYADSTYMKDYVTYQIFHAITENAPLCSYVKLSINGEYFGLYIAIEDVSGSFLDRTNDGKGELYKPGGGIDDMNGGDRDWDREEGESEGESEGDSRREEAEGAEGETAEEWNTDWAAESDGESAETAEAGEEAAAPAEGESAESEGEFTETAEAGEEAAAPAEGESRRERAEGESNGESSGEREEGESEGESRGGGFGFGGMDSGASLSYIDDNISSYSDIFDNAITNVTEEDEQKVVDALRNLSEGNIEEAVDVDSTIRYFVAHNFTINGDSYTGSMLHNYYLYERGGKLTMIPWDYNLAFGNFAGGGWGGSGATSTVNTGIDSLLSGMNESRPMWDWIVDNEEYLEKYHEVYEELISGYFESGEFEAEMNRVYEMIRPYVESDPSAFCTVEEFDTAYQTLLDFCLLRAQSIRKQLNGELSTVTNDQNAEDKVDASSVNTSDMGSMNMGGDRGDSEGESEGDSRREEAEGESSGEWEGSEDWNGEWNEDSEGESAEGESAAEAAPEAEAVEDAAPEAEAETEAAPAE